MSFQNSDWTTLVWLGIGFLGQILFGLRLLIQWLVSEKEKKSVIPLTFWYFSIGGSVILLTYAIHQQDPVFIVGQSFGLFVYFRNLCLIYSEKNKKLKDRNETLSTPHS